MEVTPFYDDKWEDFLNVPKEVFFEGYGIQLDGVFEVVMQIKFLVQLCLSSTCILFNALFVSFLLSQKQFRSWMFFPIIMQAIIDIVSAGFMNILFEKAQLIRLQQLISYQLRIIGKPRVSIQEIITSYFSKYSYKLCLLTYARILLNEYGTCYCILATAFFRYLGVCCHFTEIPANFHRRFSFILLAVIGLSFSGMALALVFDERFLFDGESIANNIGYYGRLKTGALDLLYCFESPIDLLFSQQHQKF